MVAKDLGKVMKLLFKVQGNSGNSVSGQEIVIYLTVKIK